jgi:uncharacterized protein (DUF58 family)
VPSDGAAAGRLAAAHAFRLALRGRFRGGAGMRRGLSAGGAMDFVDFRDYAPGDDLRHLDWRGYARTDQLRVRLFEDEVAPFGDVLLDLSPSMASTEQKARALRDLAHLFAGWIAGEGGRARCLRLGGGEVPDVDAVPFDGPFHGSQALAEPAARPRRRGARILVSDFLVADDPVPLLRRLSASAACFCAVQLLDPWEQDPRPQTATTLRDCETGERLDVALDLRTIDGYRQRLALLQDGLRAAVHALGGAFAVVAAGEPMAMCRRFLLPAGIVEVQS